MLKLIVADIDGSIKNSGDKYIDSKLEETIQNMPQHIKFTVATGRAFHLTTPLFRSPLLNSLGIFEGGGTIYIPWGYQ